MMALGVLLFCLTGAFTGLVIADNRSGGPTYSVTMLNNHIATLNSLEIFVSGIVLALIFAFGLWLTFGGAARARRRTVALRQARREAAAASRERDRLAARAPGGEPAATTTAAPTRTRRMHIFGH
jgi:hypothetical protein